MDDRERELAEATAELSETLESLRAELREPPEGPLGLPRPPTPRELLRFTEQYTIPTTIALLEAAIRSLELLAAALRVADGRPIDAVSGSSRTKLSTAGRDRIAATSRETLRTLDDALADLQSAARGDPSNPEVRRLLEEARDLGAEVDDRLADATDDTDPPEREPTGQSGDADDRTGVEIDVDEELASIKRTVDEAGENDSTAGDGDDPSEGGENAGDNA